MAGPSPWIDVTSYGAKCDGSTDDTPAIQAAINAAPIGGAVFIPNTGNLCNINGTQVSSGNLTSISRNSSGVVSAVVSSIPTAFLPVTVGGTTVFPPLAVYGASRGTAHSTNFNGVFVPTCVGQNPSSTCSTNGATTILWSQSPLGVDSGSTGGAISLGLWAWQENLRIFGQSGSSVSASSTNSVPGSGFSTSKPIYILTFAPQTPSSNGPQINNLWFQDSTGATPPGTALGGLYVLQSEGFSIANNFFFDFNANPAGTGLFQVGAAITLDGGTGTTAFTQFGTVLNTKAFNTRYGITTRNKVSSVTFIQDETNCSTNGGASTVLDESIGLDLGWLWYQNIASVSDTGGENSVFGHQSNNCDIGFALGSQNAGHFFGKSENPPTSTGCDVGPAGHTRCSIGVSVLNSINNLISWQGKHQGTGWHFDANSTANVMLQPAFQGTPPSSPNNTTETYSGFCGNGTCTYVSSGYTNATNWVDTGGGATGALATTEVLGQTVAPSTATTSTFTGDIIPVPLSLGTDNSVAGTVQTSSGSSLAHTIWGSGATTSNTIEGFATAPTTGDLVSCTTASTTCTLTDSGVLAANAVVASSPGLGIAHFAGSTQTVTSSAVSLTADVSGTLPIGNGGTNATGATAGTVPNATSSSAASWTANPTLGTDNSVAGTLQTANVSSNAHTIWASGATTSNTIKGFAAAPTTNDIATCSTSGTTCTLTDSATSLTTAGVMTLPNGGSIGTLNTGTPTITFGSSAIDLGSTNLVASTSGYFTTLNNVSSVPAPVTGYYGFPILVAVVDSTGNNTSMSISGNILASAASGVYMVCESTMVQSADGNTGATLQTNYSFTNSVTHTFQTSTLNSHQTLAPTETCGEFLTSATANITYAVNSSGAAGGGSYDFHAYLMRLK